MALMVLLACCEATVRSTAKASALFVVYWVAKPSTRWCRSVRTLDSSVM